VRSHLRTCQRGCCDETIVFSGQLLQLLPLSAPTIKATRYSFAQSRRFRSVASQIVRIPESSLEQRERVVDTSHFLKETPRAPSSDSDKVRSIRDAAEQRNRIVEQLTL